MFEFGDIFLSSKLIEGTYPNYRQVIPSSCEQRVTVDRESLLLALRRVSLLTTDKSNAARLHFKKNQLLVTMNTPDVGEANEKLPVKYDGKEIEIAFNPEFMMDPIKVLDNDEVFIELTDELSPGVLKCDLPFLYVLMPMRLNG
jgi:DNA polymerase-3 subunit beta